MLTLSSFRRSSSAVRAWLGGACLVFVPCLWASGCFERGDRWYLDEQSPSCKAGTRRCSGARLESCVETGGASTWTFSEDCAASGEVCAAALSSCSTCVPGTGRCDGQSFLRCDAQGREFVPQVLCNRSVGDVCRSEGCLNLCNEAAENRSNVGCEYWAVDLDNARISDVSNAAAQQFAVVLSNPQPDIEAQITIDQDDAAPLEPSQVQEVARGTVPPFSLRVFKLGPREVDGSLPGTFDTGTGTALSRAAYRIRSDLPIVAYQFNPLENVNVFSNDASLLKPVEAVRPSSNDFRDAYVVSSWPQTIASSDDPATNFGSDLRAFLTLVGTQAETQVRITPTARVIPGGPIPETDVGEAIDIELGAFDVLNLETGGFNADFTGTLIQSDGPLIVFTGSEASDAPYFSTLSRRSCCADHLEEQLDPIRTAGRSFVLSVSPNRTEAVRAAGAKIDRSPQQEFFRVLAVTDAGARVSTTLGGSDERFALPDKGSYLDIFAAENFALESDAPVIVTSVSPSQDAAQVPRGLPGGDPSLLVVPPTEQFRANYVFLTPDKYIFDFVRLIAPPDAVVVFDGQLLSTLENCRVEPILIPNDADVSSGGAVAIAESWVVHTCQLSFPLVDPEGASPNNVSPGFQNDGVHRISSSHPIGVLVDGFDSYVSYAYAAGTELDFIVPE